MSRSDSRWQRERRDRVEQAIASGLTASQITDALYLHPDVVHAIWDDMDARVVEVDRPKATVDPTHRVARAWVMANEGMTERAIAVALSCSVRQVRADIRSMERVLVMDDAEPERLAS